MTFENKEEQEYLKLISEILSNGDERIDRTKVGTKALFGKSLKFDLQKGFPLLTTKKLSFKFIAHELLWFLKGETNIKYLKENKVTIWDEWADENGNLGPIYGKQWRNWETWTPVSYTKYEKNSFDIGSLSKDKNNDELFSFWKNLLLKCYDNNHSEYVSFGAKDFFVDESWHNYETFKNDISKLENWNLKKTYPNEFNLVSLFSNKFSKEDSFWINENDIKLVNGFLYRRYDQIKWLIAEIKQNPSSRRLVVSAWNVGELAQMKLNPCHHQFQFFVENNKLSCSFTMRSSDVFLGLPYNIASYALLTHLIAKECDLEVGSLTYFGGDTHLYLNHFDQVKTQIQRIPKQFPQLVIKGNKNIFEYKVEDFEVIGYNPDPPIKGPVAV